MENLHKIRTHRNFTQVGLSTRIGIGQESISAYEMGKSFPSVKTLMKLCDELMVSSDYLLGRTDIPLPADQFWADKLSADEVELIQLYRSLPPRKRERAVGIILGIK